MPMLRLSGLRLSFVDGVEDVAVAEGDPALVGRLEPGEAAQRRRLAAAARAEQDEELALLDLEVEVVHRGRRRLAGEPLGEPLDAQVGHSGTSRSPSSALSGAVTVRAPVRN